MALVDAAEVRGESNLAAGLEASGPGSAAGEREGAIAVAVRGAGGGDNGGLAVGGGLGLGGGLNLLTGGHRADLDLGNAVGGGDGSGSGGLQCISKGFKPTAWFQSGYIPQ